MSSLGKFTLKRRRGGGQLCGMSVFRALVHATQTSVEAAPGLAVGHPALTLQNIVLVIDWIQVLLSLCVLGVIFKGVQWLQTSNFELEDARLEASELSSLTVHVSSSGTGLMNKYFYRFKNVRIRRDRMKFYYDPDGSFVPPTEEYWVDIISCNATSARPPTTLVIKVDAPVRWKYLPIDYIPVRRRTDACHASATSVVKQTAYLLQVRYSYNIWHTWGEAGLMSMFQTLREINALPIATVDPTGSLLEIHEGDGGCPWTYDHELQRPVRQDSCEKLRIRDGASCSLQSDPWCRPGAVVSPLRDDPSLIPRIITYTPQSTNNVWSHLYDTISSSQKTLADLDGACFEDLVVGKSSTLNFYQALNTTPPAASILEKVPRIDNSKARIKAMDIFKSFIISSQREWVERNGLSFEGYSDDGLEVLRQGVTEVSDALNAINPKDCAGNIREEVFELKKSFSEHQKQVQAGVLEFERQYDVTVPSTLSGRSAVQLRDEESEGYLVRQNKGLVVSFENNDHDGKKQTASRAGTYKESSPNDLPVVTYMSRNFFSRGVINEIDILKYVLENYNVVLKVTTFQEPLLEVMDLLSQSDVIFGMHGAGWTNLLFMKRGATTMQMYPHGWMLPNNSTVRGYNYREIVLASEGKYLEWVNPLQENSYFRRIDFKKDRSSRFALHPGDDDIRPQDSWPGNQWIYQNTYVDMAQFGPTVDDMMHLAGIQKVSRQQIVQS